MKRTLIPKESYLFVFSSFEMHAIEVFCPLVPFYFSNIVLPKLKTLENLEEFYTFKCIFSELEFLYSRDIYDIFVQHYSMEISDIVKMWNRVGMLTQKKCQPIVKIYPRIVLSIFFFCNLKNWNFSVLFDVYSAVKRL